MLDDEDAVAFVGEALQQFHEQGDVIEVQARGRLIEEEESLEIGERRLEEMADELEALGFATAEGIERLTETQIAETRLAQQAHGFHDTSGAFRFHAAEELRGIIHGHAQDLMDVLSLETETQRVRLVAPAFALRAGHVEIAQELHLDLFVAISPAALAATVTAVEAEKSRRESFGARVLRFHEELPDRIKRAHINSGCAARGARERTLINHDNGADFVFAFDGFHAARLILDAFAALPHEVPVKHVMHQRALAAATHAGDAAEHAQRDVHAEVFQIVLFRADDAQGLAALGRAPLFRHRDALTAKEIVASE